MIHRKELAVVVLVSMMLLGAEDCEEPGDAPRASKQLNYSKISIPGNDQKNGYFDVSVEYGPDGVGWLAYSRVEIPKYIGTHIAKSTDKGKTWSYVAEVNPSADGTMNFKGREYKGVWRNETVSLLYDPRDNENRRWKLFSQRYMVKPGFDPGDRMFENSWVEYRYASSPAGPWSEPVKLFGHAETGSLIDLATIHPDLRDVKHFNEIGSLEVDGVIYLSMDASTTDSGFHEWDKRKVVLVSSGDHGKTWKYNGTLTDYDDAKSFGYIVFTGSALAREGNRLFALFTPSKREHDGVYVFEFEDITKAKLKRGPDGKLAVVKRFEVDLDSGGLSDYDEGNVNGGLLMTQIDSKARPDVFQAYSTHQNLTSP